MDTWLRPPKMGLSLASALIMRLFAASCSLFLLMYSQSFLVTSVRGAGAPPITAPSSALGIIGFMKAAFGARFTAGFLAADFFAGVAFFATAFLATGFFAAGFLAATFFAAGAGFFAVDFLAADFLAA